VNATPYIKNLQTICLIAFEDIAGARRYTRSIIMQAIRSTPHDREDRERRTLEATVRRLLRRSTDSYRLAAFPLAQALCQATGIANAQLALRHVVEAAFRNTPQENQLRDLVLQSDLDCDLSRTESAARWQVSRRHFQRYHAQAVSIVTAHIRELVKPMAHASLDGEGLSDPLDILSTMLAPFEPAAAARLASLGSPDFATGAYVLSVRARVEAGHEVLDIPDEMRLGRSRSLLAVLQAQSKQLNGKEDEAKGALRSMLTDPDRDPAYDAEALFELEWLAFLRARHRGDTSDMSRSANNLRRIAQDRFNWRSRAFLAEAETHIRFGRILDATNLLDDVERLSMQTHRIGLLASTTALRAEAALSVGDHSSAERLAQGGYLVLQGRHYDSYGCLATIARVRLRLCKTWTLPSDTTIGVGAWDRVRLVVENARHLCARGLHESAGLQAREAFDAAIRSGFRGLAARAAATLGALAPANTQVRRDWLLKAFAHHLVTRDRYAACDLFSEIEELESQSFHDDTASAIYAALVAAIPQLGIDPYDSKDAATNYLKHLGRYVLATGEPSPALDEAQDACATDARSFAQFLLRFQSDAADIICAASIALSPNRDDHRNVEVRLQMALETFAQRVRPVAMRQFLVG